MSKPYHVQSDGEWVFPVHRGYRLACCDCGSVHDIDFRVVNGRVSFRATKNYRATAARRRHAKNRKANPKLDGK